ncbi:hypothetical protein P8452_47555 [Trifolium repens]|nr:hypothetical protein P8452_47555 [Trifolium repens]
MGKSLYDLVVKSSFLPLKLKRPLIMQYEIKLSYKLKEVLEPFWWSSLLKFVRIQESRGMVGFLSLS